MFDWQNARSTEIRELGWSLFSPDMITPLGDRSDSLVEEDATMDALLAELDRHPTALRQHLEACRDRRLGHRFETLWSFYLHRHSFYRVLAENLQIGDGDRTLGALDLLVHDTRLNKVVHLELAVKFYLHVARAPGTGTADWLGPNPDDRLQGKVDHLLTHQLPLSQKPQTLRLLKSRGLPCPDQRCALIKGYLFQPPGTVLDTAPPVHPDHLQGLWVHSERRAELAEHFPNSHWQILDKPRWLDPSPPGGVAWEDLEPRLACRDNSARAVMLHRHPPPGEPRSRTPQRCLIMPTGWPR